MKPIAIFRHAPSEGPGFFADFLDAQGLPWTLIAIDAGEPLPRSASEFGGLAFMGGPMSVNDDLPWINGVLQLIREAVAAGIPVLGHCLGAQLMSRALGGAISRNAVKEIGWGEVWLAEDEAAGAREVFGDIDSFEGFHWHGETFSIPPHATRLLHNAFCDNQAFRLGPHIGLQCHIEMTATMVNEWCQLGALELAESAASPAVMQAAQMELHLPERITALQLVASRVYRYWIRGLRH